MSLLPSRLPHGGEVPDSRVVIGEAAGPLDDKAAVTAEDEPSAPAGVAVCLAADRHLLVALR